MPWKPADATSHTKKAKSPAAKRQFAKVANKVLEETGDEGKAIRIANSVVAKRKDHGAEPAHPHDPYQKRRSY